MDGDANGGMNEGMNGQTDAGMEDHYSYEDDSHQYETVDMPQPIWKSYLFQVQNQAPAPSPVVCDQHIPNKPSYYGTEYHGMIAREEAEHLVMRSEGSFLARESQRTPGTYALTFRFNNQARNYKLYYDEDERTHYVGEKRFDTIHDLVADGLITMYVDLNAKDYIDSMTLNARSKQHRQRTTEERAELAHAAEDMIFSADQSQTDEQSLQRTQTESAAYSNEKEESADGGERVRANTAFSKDTPKRRTFKAAECAKEHVFKTHTYRGFVWCQFCANFMWGLSSQGVRCQDCSYDCHKQCSSQIGNNCSPDKKLVRKVFGVDLTTLIKAHDWRRPIVVDRCIEEIEKRGLELEGLYRIPGFNDDIQFYKNTVDKDGDLPDISVNAVEDINVICGLVKLYLRMLPIPVIPFDIYEQFIEVAKLKDRDLMIQQVYELLKRLPPAHLETLKYFLRHLHRVQKYKENNKMSSENLAIVFGPTLMRAPDHMAMQAIGNLNYQKIVIQVLIEEQDILFT